MLDKFIALKQILFFETYSISCNDSTLNGKSIFSLNYFLIAENREI